MAGTPARPEPSAFGKQMWIGRWISLERRSACRGRSAHLDRRRAGGQYRNTRTSFAALRGPAAAQHRNLAIAAILSDFGDTSPCLLLGTQAEAVRLRLGIFPCLGRSLSA